MKKKSEKIPEAIVDFSEVAEMRGVPKERKAFRDRIDELTTSGLSKSEATIKAIEENPPQKFGEDE